MRRFWPNAAILTALVSAAPAPVQRRDITAFVLNELDLFAQYSAAAYCSSNFGGSTGSSITCSVGNCPRVQTADTTILLEFDETNEFGDATGFIAVDHTNELIVLAFRGSSDLSNWIADLDIPLTSVDFCSGCEVHSGFWANWQTVQSMIESEIASALGIYPGYTLAVTGHSLGAALAALAATSLRIAGYNVQLYDYGQPRVGNYALAEFITSETMGGNYRVTHTDDIVPKLPPDFLGYAQFSPEYWITSGNNVAVTASDVNLVVGIDSTAGNDGTWGDSISAHNWYFVYIDEC